MTLPRKTSARGKSPAPRAPKAPAEPAASSGAADVAADVAATDWWPLYVAYCAVEVAGALKLCPAGTLAPCLGVLALQFCLLLRARYWDTVSTGVDVHMQLKGLPLMLVCLWRGPGATNDAVWFALQWFPTELRTWATGHCADVGRFRNGECQMQSSTTLFWQLVTVANLVIALASRSKAIPCLMCVACMFKSMM